MRLLTSLLLLARAAFGWRMPPPVARHGRATVRLCAAPSEGGAMLPPPAELSDEALLSIVLQQASDEEVNELLWKYLGYVRDGRSGKWDAAAVFPNWAKKFPTPPDLIGVTHTYTREVDEPVLRAVQSLQRSVPSEYKDRLRPTLRPLGWGGYKLDGLTPNKTRRAQAASWLLYYRTALHGVPIDELKRRKAARQAAEEAARNTPPTGTTKQGVI